MQILPKNPVNLVELLFIDQQKFGCAIKEQVLFFMVFLYDQRLGRRYYSTMQVLKRKIYKICRDITSQLTRIKSFLCIVCICMKIEFVS